jgi:putative tryptophan/tyrosine transport system substrate-binding protein
MRRRKFLKLVGVSAAAWPSVAFAVERTRRVGVLWNFGPEDRERKARLVVFRNTLQQLGWTDGRNLRIEERWNASDPEGSRKGAGELLQLSPDVVLATGTPAVAALQQSTRTVPVVFVAVADPVSSGLVRSLARPGENITGFINFDDDLCPKWLELLKELAPRITRIGVIRDPTNAASVGQFTTIRSAAPSLGVEVSALGGREPTEIERTVTELARRADCGLISVATPLVARNRDLIISLAARYNLPATYPYRFFVVDGGLASYGPDAVGPYREAATYVDRILKGEKPADLPVQAPTKYELIINLKTARTLGLVVPPALVSRADVVIE